MGYSLFMAGIRGTGKRRSCPGFLASWEAHCTRFVPVRNLFFLGH
jgi:hypothetical protein